MFYTSRSLSVGAKFSVYSAFVTFSTQAVIKVLVAQKLLTHHCLLFWAIRLLLWL